MVGKLRGFKISCNEVKKIRGELNVHAQNYKFVGSFFRAANLTHENTKI